MEYPMGGHEQLESNMSRKSSTSFETDNSSLFFDSEIQKILSQFNNTASLAEIQTGLFGSTSETNLDPHLSFPTDLFESVPLLSGKVCGKRPAIVDIAPEEPALKKQKIAKSSEEVDEDDDIDKASTHRMNEKRRRMKMNDKIQELRHLLPEQSEDVLTSKLSVLHESVKYMRELKEVLGAQQKELQLLRKKNELLLKENLLIRQIVNQRAPAVMAGPQSGFYSPPAGSRSSHADVTSVEEASVEGTIGPVINANSSSSQPQPQLYSSFRLARWN